MNAPHWLRSTLASALLAAALLAGAPLARATGPEGPCADAMAQLLDGQLAPADFKKGGAPAATEPDPPILPEPKAEAPGKIRQKTDPKSPYPVYEAPEMEVPAAGGTGKLKAEKTEFLGAGRNADSLLTLHTSSTAERKVLGRGGMQTVYRHPGKPGRAVKVYDRELIWKNRRLNLERIIASGGPDAEKARKALTRSLAEIRPGDTVPASVDKLIAAMMRRQKAYGAHLRSDIIPGVQKELQKKYPDLKVTMADGLEHPTPMGVTETELIQVGPIHPEDPKSPVWVEASSYLQGTSQGSARERKILDLKADWEASLKPHNDTLIESNKALEASLRKGGKPIGLDIGNPQDGFGNVFLLLDHKGNPMEIKISDF